MTNENNNSALIALRPLIPKAKTNLKTSKEEHFQNTVLRPIIKFSSDSIIAIVSTSIHKFNKAFNELSINKKTTAIETFLVKNQKIKSILVGMTLGLMTNDEIKFYLQNASECNKRIMQMIEQRSIDHIEFF